MLEKQCFHEVLTIPVLTLKKTPTPTTALYYYAFKHHWEGIKLKCMGCTCDAVLRPRGAAGSGGTRGLWEVMEGDLWGTTPAWQGPHGLQWIGKKWKSTRTLGQKRCFQFFSQPQGCICGGQGWDAHPGACEPSKGMRGADPAGSTPLSRPECPCSVARWAVQGLRQSSLKSVRAFPLISRTLD